MNQLKRILAATDLSAPSRHAAERAALLARDLGARLDLVHVTSIDFADRLRRLVANVPTDFEQRLLGTLQEDVRRMAEGLHQRYGVSAGVHVVSGPVLSMLASQADAMAADLFVLGARGAGFMRHLLLGSTAEKMLRMAARPMLVAKQPRRGSYQRVLVPVDFSPSSMPALALARAVASSADIVLLHAFEVPFEGKLRFAGVEEDAITRYRAAAKQEALEKMGHMVAAAGMPPGTVTRLVLHGDASLHIVEQEQEQDCDLIVIGKHGENRLQELLLGSVTKHVLVESQCDVLVAV